MRMMMKLCAALPLSLFLCSLAAADDEIQAAVDNLTRSINASVARDIEQANANVKAARKSAGVTSGNNVTVITCTDAAGNPQSVTVKGLTKNTVIVNCRTDEDGQPHITVKGDGATREIGTVRVEGSAENIVIINKSQIGADTGIVAEGKNARASVGTVTVKNAGNLGNTVIMNNNVITGGSVKATGDGATATAGSTIIQ